MIRLEGLSKRFGEKVAVSDLNLTVSKGEILGFLGPNGAGKTTTVKMLTGMLLPTSGSAKVAGFDVVAEPLEVKKRIGYVPESGALFESLTAWDYLELISELHHLERKTAHRRIEEFLTIFDLLEVRDQMLSQYSKGMKQKVLFSAALLHNPQVLFLDEPLSGLDANAALVIKDLLRKFAEQGKTVMFCSHILEVVERVCTRIVIIHRGKIVADGLTADILSQTSQATLEKAFGKLTDSPDSELSAHEFLRALESVDD
ncbi:MAG: ABC transporter ATP-binding protein [Calditrichaeota bacterium]|nr:MAG: ABC transporter ATP-binding protein [Calditrichota bacterium]